MGMYTEFHFNAALKKSTPKEIIYVLKYMCGQRESQDGLDLRHYLFDTDRTERPGWKYMLRGESYSFPFACRSSVFFVPAADRFLLNVKSSFKNYDGDIRLFLDWILPFINADEDDLLGFHRYEDTREPTLIYGYPGGFDRND